MIAVALLGALAGLAALGWSGVFPAGHDVAVLAATGAVAAAATGLLARTRLGVAARSGALVAGFVVAATAAAERRPPTPAAIADVAIGLRDGWAQILDTRLPVAARGGPMTTAVAVLWASGCLTTTAHLAGRRSLRLVPPLVALATGLLFGAPAAPPPPITAALVVAIAAGLCAARAGVGPRRQVRAAAMGAIVVAVVAVVGTAWPGTSAREPFDPRRLRDQPVTVAPADNPLSALGGALDGPDEQLFRATVHGDAAASPWRLVVLDRFDGEHWTSSGTFRRIGAEIRPPEVDAPTVEIDQTVTVADRFDGPLLPVTGSPVEIDAGDGRVLATDDQGAVALTSGGGRPERYRIRSAVPRPEPARLAQAPPVTTRPLVPPPELGDSLRTIVTETRQAAGADASAAGYLKVLRDWFLDNIRLAPVGEGHDAPPTGHGYHAIDRLLHESEGTPEQFASAFAVVAEMQGYDARVVAGYRPGEPDPGTSELVVTTHDAYAWPEVRFEGVGWLDYHPTPSEAVEGDPAAAPPPEPAAPSVTDAVPATPATDTEPADDRPADDSSRTPATQHGRSWLARTVLAAVGAIVVALGAIGALVVAKAVRRRRQQRGTPAERVAGAWSAAVDRLAEGGVAVPRHLTATEVAEAPGVPTSAVEPLVDLGALANACRFSGAPATEADAATAWSTTTRIATAVRAERHPLRLTLHPAPLLRR